ncbi:hypothetical protein [Clostridium sp. DJ247]|uniref:restriction endonuclease-related protein n=1 Tax=Clostridium sp. DJ247 TaxID=2726188 RepID=UPI001629C2B7|nr:hypothetical protein [Clostridium sp. DJ247]MBC2582287.1 hypothetical protein [Clostridium sp. DJ247]
MEEKNDYLTEEQGMKHIQYYCYSLVKMMEDNLYFGMMTDWTKASVLLNMYSIKTKAEKSFPMTMDEQTNILRYSINTWGIGHFSDIEGIDMPLIIDSSEDIILSDLAITLARQYNRNAGAEDLEKIKKLCRDGYLKLALYARCRELLIRNPLVTEKDFMYIEDELQSFIDKQGELVISQTFGGLSIIDVIENHYEEISIDPSSKESIYLCPYCGYPLSYKNKRNSIGKYEKHYYCISSACLNRKSINNKKEKIHNKNQRLFKLKKDIMYSVVIPGIIEVNLYDYLEEIKDKINAEIELYPGADKADVLIKFKHGEVWAIDAKDWINPNELANNLNFKGFMKNLYNSANYKITTGFLILPEDVKDNYINVLKAKWKDAYKYNILKINEFIKQLKEMC